MNDVFSIQQSKALHEGVCEPPDETQTEALVVVFLDQFVEIQTSERERKRWVVSQSRPFYRIKVPPKTRKRDTYFMSSKLIHKWFLK